jgi:hypothetical protein
MRRLPSGLLASSLLSTIALTGSVVCAADLIAYEGFNYGGTSTLHGLNGGSGFSAAWVKNQQIPTGVAGPGLTWPNLVTAGNCAVTPSFGGTAYSIYTRLLSSYSAPGGVVYASFLFEPLPMPGEGGGIEFGPLTGGMIIGAHPGTGHYGLMDTSFSGVDTGVPMQPNVTALCVVRIDDNFDGTITYGLYMNPTVGQPEPAFAEATYTMTGALPNLVRVMNDGGFATDEIRIGKTWASVLPSTLPPACLGDLDNNAAVDAADLSVLLGAWGGAGGDLDGSGSTDAADLSILLGAWGPCS